MKIKTTKILTKLRSSVRVGIGVWSELGRTPQTFLLEAFPQKFAPTKISRYTVHGALTIRVLYTVSATAEAFNWLLLRSFSAWEKGIAC